VSRLPSPTSQPLSAPRLLVKSLPLELSVELLGEGRSGALNPDTHMGVLMLSCVTGEAATPGVT